MVYVSKWPALASAACLQLAAGAAYTFSLYAPSLKEKLNLSQTQVEGIGSALLCGGLFAWAPGFVYDGLTSYHKLGPRISGLIGVLFHFIGYFIIYIGSSGLVTLPYWVFILAGLVASNSLLWLDTTSIVTCMRNFPNEHGSIAEQRLLVAGGIVALLLVYQLATALIGQIVGLSSAAKIAIMCIALLLLLLDLASFVVKIGGLISKPASLPGHVHGHEGEESQLMENGRQSANGVVRDPSEEGRKSNGKAALRQWNLGQCLVSLDYWVLWLAMFIGIGSGFTFLNNLGQHVEALGGKQGSQEVYVLLFATFNCVGRMICGFGSEWLLHRFAVPRTVVLLGLSASTTVIYVLVAVAGLRFLVPLAMVAGLVFGGHWALMPSCTSELFGARHFAANQSIIHLATAVGALGLSTLLAGSLYQRQGSSHGDPPGACYGHDCFRWTFVTIAGCSLLQTLLSVLLNQRSRVLYKTMYSELQHYQEEATQ